MLRLAALAVLLGAPVEAARFDVVVESRSPAATALVQALRAGAAGQGTLDDLSAIDIADPIQKGKLVARLSKADLLVPIGDAATRFVGRELDSLPVFFVGASVVEDALLASPNVAGILALDPNGVLRAASALGLKRVGIVYTPGYDPVAASIAVAAPAAGVALRKIRVRPGPALVSDLRNGVADVDAVWILGDPLVARGAGFEFLLEQSLARRIPILAPGAWEVTRGALLYVQVGGEALAAPASAALNAILADNVTLPARRLQTSSGGTVIYNQRLVRSWGLSLPKEAGWQPNP